MNTLGQTLCEKQIHLEKEWICDEDTNLFNNDNWVSSKEIIVNWPKDCAKWRRISTKTAIDINEVETERYPAKIVKFSGKCILFL